jgi:hypothetical protein
VFFVVKKNSFNNLCPKGEEVLVENVADLFQAPGI